MIKLFISIGNVKYFNDDHFLLERTFPIKQGSKYSKFYQTIAKALITFPLHTFELLISDIIIARQLAGTLHANPSAKYYKDYFLVKYLLRSRSYKVTYTA